MGIKKPRLDNRGYKVVGEWGLGLGHFAGLNGLYRDPHAFDLTAGKLDADALHVGTETTLGVLNQAGTDTTALFGETFTDDATAFYGSLACDCADTCHV